MKKKGDTKEKDQNHFVGKESRCGYERVGDHVWQVAPSLSESMQKIQNDRNGLNAYIAATNEYLVKISQAIESRQGSWWNRVQKDLEGIAPPNGTFQYDYNNGTVMWKEAPKEEAPK